MEHRLGRGGDGGVRRGLATSAPAAAASVEWLRLDKHPVFNRPTSTFPTEEGTSSTSSRNLADWNSASSRLYLWDREDRCLYRLAVRFGDPDAPEAVEAASPCEVLLPDIQSKLFVHFISLNRDGSSLLLAKSDGLYIMYIYDRVSSGVNGAVCRSVPVGSGIYFGQKNALRILQVSWHPHSSTHLGILSSDSVFRIYDLSTDLERPEQEFFLQPVEPGRCRNAVSICPVAFSFGGEHLWDKFAVFILFSDGSIYVLCPVVPFGSFFRWPCIEEIYEDANVFGLNSSNSEAISNSKLAITWLEATFTELADQSTEKDNILVSRAHPYAPLDASIILQGPLPKVRHGDNENSFWEGDSAGKAVNFLYCSIGKDSVLVTAWSTCQLWVDALADEVQPLWNVGCFPRLRVNEYGHVEGVAMICESNSKESSTLKPGQLLKQGMSMSNMAETVWSGHPPPLLRLAIVDLALPKDAVNNCPLSVFSDPLFSERIYCLHRGGIDLIVLHFLPFSNLIPGAEVSAKAPSVYPILNTCYSNSCSASPLSGFAAIEDPSGHVRIVGITSSYECVVLEMKGWTDMVSIHVDEVTKSVGSADAVMAQIISKELLSGPKVVLVPESMTLRSLTADSIEGRSTLHHYIKLFLENYVEYAHKVYVELEKHAEHLETIINGQDMRLQEANQMLLKLEAKEPDLEERINQAFQTFGDLELRLQRLRTLPGANKKPLSIAEREFKAQLGRFNELELGALRSSIEALNSRLGRCMQTSTGSSAVTPRHTQQTHHHHVPDLQLSQLKFSMEKLSLLNSENTKKVKLIDHTLKHLQDS